MYNIFLRYQRKDTENKRTAGYCRPSPGILLKGDRRKIGFGSFPMSREENKCASYVRGWHERGRNGEERRRGGREAFTLGKKGEREGGHTESKSAFKSA